MQRRQAILLFLVPVLLGLTACGGSGSGSETSPSPPVNQSPTANAGADQTVDEQTVVNLTGTASDSDGSISSTNWSQDSGVPVDIEGENTLSASFNGPVVISAQDLVFTLLVTDNSGATASDQVTITIAPVNASPVVQASTNFGAYERDVVLLAATATDEDGSVDEFNWEQTAGPQVALLSPQQASTTFNAPRVDSITQLNFTVTVTDNELRQASDQVAVTIHPLAEFGGPILQNTLLNGVYEITSDLSVAPNVTLTLSPGTTLKFPPAAQFSVSGQLLADGTESQAIFFTYLELSANNPLNSWSGIDLLNSSDSSITYSVIENAAYGIDLNGVSPINLNNNLFRHNSVAVTDTGSYQSMTVNRNTFSGNDSVFSGIRTSGNSLFSGNAFVDNPSIFPLGYYFDITTIEQNSFEGAEHVIRAPESGFGYGTVTAIGNWWGTTSETEVASLITDINDDASLQQIVYTPILDVPPAVAGSTLPNDIRVPSPEYVVGTPVPAESGPPSGAPTEFAVSETFLQLLLTWVNPSFNVQHIEVWRSAENNLATASLLATTVGNQYLDNVGADANLYYWIRAVGTNGAHSAFNDTIGTSGTTGPSVVVVGDKAWRQVNETMGLYWSQVAAVCNQVTGACSGVAGSVDLTGWVWASAVEVGELFSTLTPHPGDLSQYNETGSQWAPNFFSLFNPTEAVSTRTFIRGLTRTTYSSSSGPPIQAYAAFIADLSNPESFDIATNIDNANLSVVYSITGLWLYQPISPP